MKQGNLAFILKTSQSMHTHSGLSINCDSSTITETPIAYSVLHNACNQVLICSFIYTDAAEVKPSLSIDIRGKINTRLLTSNTIYGAYLLIEGGGFEAKAMITFVNEETDADAERRASTVQLVSGGREVALGSFYVGVREERDVEARLVETSSLKAGFVVEGIEFRPLVNVKMI